MCLTTFNQQEEQQIMNSEVKKLKGKSNKIVTHKINHLNTESRSKMLGKIELKYISFADAEFFADLLQKVKNDKEFVARLLHHQLVIPKLSFSKFSKISDDELRKLARDFIEQEQHIFEYFEGTTDAKFFCDFRKAIEKYYQKLVEQLRIGPVVESIKNIFDNFNRQYVSIIKQPFDKTSSITESIKEFNKFVVQFRDSQLRIAESLKSAIEPYQLTARILSEKLQFLIESWQKWVEENKILFDSYKNYWQKFQDKYKISRKEAIQSLRKYKWFTTPSLPLNLLFEAVEIGRRGGNQRGAMNKLFADFFSANNFANIGILVEKWEASIMFKPRMKIFRDCVSALREAKSDSNPSNLVIPTLIAQIDGIQTEFMKQKGLSFDLKKRKWRDGRGNDVNWKAWFKDQTSNQDLLDLANDIFLSILFQKSQPGIPLETPFTFNRHKIMHGEYLKYGRIDNTIRAFLILDFLATLK